MKCENPVPEMGNTRKAPNRKGTRKGPGRQIPILPKSGLFLSCRYGNGERFAGLFAETWQALPIGVRRRLMRQWRTHESQTDGRPMIELVGRWEDRWENRWKHRPSPSGRRFTVAIVYSWGCYFYFCAPYVEAMPDEVVCAVIAHKLARAFQHASGITKDACVFGKEELEKAADDLVELWGHKVRTIEDWANSAGIDWRLNQEEEIMQL